MPKICKDGRISGQNNKEAGDHLGILKGSYREDGTYKRPYNYIKKYPNIDGPFFKKGHKPWWKEGEIPGTNTRFKKGHKPKWTGKKRPEVTGSKHGNWNGGTSRKPYAFEFSNELKEEIRKRDNYTCQRCGLKQGKLTGYHKKLSIHHIDYNRNNTDKMNLITLCNPCNNKVNINRSYWKSCFSGELKNALYGHS